jgi:uncharacterized protein YcbX
MIVDEQGNFLSQRTHTEMALYETAIDGETIIVYYKNSQISFSIEEQLEGAVSQKGMVWDSEASFYEVSAYVSQWFSYQLQKEVKLVRQDDDTPRIKNYSNREGKTEVSLADGYPILILGTASVDNLNEKLEKKVKADRFRANIIVKTSEAHIEDTWSTLNIGSSQIEVIKPCARCQVVNINQTTSQSTKQVLKTLSNYRKKENKVYFGANASCLREGRIKVGDTLYIKT